MGAEVVLETEAGNDQDGREDLLVLMPDAIEVRRNAGTAGLLGVAGAAIAIAYFARATQTGAVLDWVLALIMGLLGAYWLRSLVDARTPLLVADDQGLRLRLGRRWHGLPWSAVNRLEYTPRQGLLREGRISVAPHNDEVLVSELDPLARAQTALAQRLHGARYTVPLGLTTRVVGVDADLATALAEVVQGRCGIEEPHRGQEPVSTDLDSHPEDHSDLAPEPDAEPVASATPVPLRAASSGRRSEIRRDTAEQGMDDSDRPQGRELHRPGSVNLVEETQAWGDRISPIARAGDPVEPLVIDEFEVEPALDPVIGPELAAARTRLGLTVDELAVRTRIRPHVIESIEVDDFEPCGGDFYARGHLRTLARTLGIDGSGMLETYHERYAHAPINPRRVFEAELATGMNGSIRSTRGGPNWSLLIAVVMALVLCWSVARLVMDSPPEVRSETPVLNGSGGPNGVGSAPLAKPVAVVLTATGGAHVVVRDGAGEIVFKGNLAAGQTKELDAAPPVRVQSSDGALSVSLDGAEAKPVGDQGVAGQATFVAH